MTVGTGNDVVIAGNGVDGITDTGGRNLLIGDQGEVTFAGAATWPRRFRMRAIGGGLDTFDSAAGDDIILGGSGGDTINAGAGNNVVLGDFGNVQFTAGVVSYVEGTNQVLAGADQSRGQSATIWSSVVMKTIPSPMAADVTSCWEIAAQCTVVAHRRQ